MKRILFKSGILVFYIIILISFMDFKLRQLFDIKLILLVAAGTAMLTFANYKRGMEKETVLEYARWNAMVAGYITCFLLLFSRFSLNQSLDGLLGDIALHCRPLLYGMMISVLCRQDKTEADSAKDGEEKKTGRPVENREPDFEKLQYLDLTGREIEIAKLIWEGKSNKEIGSVLFISEATVKKHTSGLYRKVQVANREQLKQWLRE